MPARHTLPLLVGLLALATTVGHGQAPTGTIFRGGQGSETPVFRTGAEAVAIDVFVTDADGNPVSGLTVDDFELDENGRRQDITTFKAVHMPVEVEADDRPLAEPDVAANDQPEGRVYVIANAIADPCNALKARAFLKRFLDRYFAPNDVAAVVNLGRGLASEGQDFTSNRRLLQTAIDKIGNSTGGECGESSQGSSIDIRDLRDLLDVLGRVPGRHKSFIYLNEGTGGFQWADLIDYQGGVGSLRFEYAHAAMGIATRNNITIYPIDPQGLTTELGLQSLERRMDQRALAEITGGFAHLSSNDFDGAFARIVRDASTYYMLGFNSDYRKNDGKFVRLNVRVKRPGLTVRTRSGYVSADRREQQAAARRAQTSRSRTPIVEALSNPLTAAGHPMRVTAAAYRGDKDASTVVLTIETSLLMQAPGPRDDVRRGRIDLRMIATGESRRVYPEVRLADTMSMPAQVAELTGNRVRIVSEMALPKGRHQIRIASSGEQLAGNVVYDLDVPDFTSQPLMMSGLSIAAASIGTLPTVRAANDSKKARTKKCYEPSCSAQEVRDVPLAAWSNDTLSATHPLRNALPAPPTTTRAFQRTDTISVFAEIYDNKGPRPVNVRVELRQPERTPSFETSRKLDGGAARASGGQGVTLDVSLADVSPGRYVLRVEAAAPGTDHSTTREIPVEILP
jgi:VWFA-related protein